MGSFSIDSSTFSGADILASVTVPLITNDPQNGGSKVISKPITIANIQTLSINTMRQKAQVHVLGRVAAKGTTRGVRTCAGSIVFAMFDREALSEVQATVREFYQQAHITYNTAYGNSTIPDLIPNFRSDELPPFDITITMANEYGNAAVCKLIGVDLMTDGMVMGINEMYLEQEVRYLALDFVPLYPAFFQVTSDKAKLS